MCDHEKTLSEVAPCGETTNAAYVLTYFHISALFIDQFLAQVNQINEKALVGAIPPWVAEVPLLLVFFKTTACHCRKNKTSF